MSKKHEQFPEGTQQPCASYERKDSRRVEEGKRQRKGGEMGNLSQVSVKTAAYRLVVSSYPFPPRLQIFPIQ